MIFSRGTYLIFENTLDVPHLTIEPAGAKLEVVASLSDLVELSRKGYDLSRLNLDLVRTRVANQAIVFCIFISNRLVHRSWVSTCRDADIDPIAPHLDYEASAYIGDCLTWPEYRGLGLYPFTLSVICRALKSKGFPKAMLTVAPDNKSSIFGVTKAGFQQVGKGQLVQFFLWSDWQVHNKTQQNHRRGSGGQ
jgi:hypothetical protein